MRQLIAFSTLVLLPVLAQAHEHTQEQAEHDAAATHAALHAHEHGVAELDVAFEGTRLDLELRSPAINLLGFEHAPAGEPDERRIAAVSGDLQQPQRLFGIPAQAGCAVSEQEIDGSLLGSNHAGYNREGTSRAADDNGHSDILARYRLLCSEPTKLTQLDLSALFAGYPGLERVRVQLIGPGGQRAAELGLRAATLEF
ncbi:DUF2796 domain-containing protein [Stutzerimonas balearica]|uniref:DUF2796 domain-containing protein n=1 Tax=Stutzerimonas balearica TaxID=74829 RepID=UPI003F75B611